jgi:S1-C subfamily serine protease
MPQAASEVSFESQNIGKTGWSKYEDVMEFPNVGPEMMFQAAKAGLVAANFNIRRGNADKGVVIGEHGLTAYDWNVVAGVYYTATESGTVVKVIAEGSKDFGFSGDATGAPWPQLILNGIVRHIERERSRSGHTESPRDKAKKGHGVVSGTGFFIASDGHLITAAHVVEGSENIRVLYGGLSHDASVVKISRVTDLALLKIDAQVPDYLSLGTADQCNLGDKVFTVGFPIAQLINKAPVYSEGVISALSGLGGESSMMQVSTPIQPGNSGGPMVDSGGRVIGVVTSSAAVVGFFKTTGTLPQNVNWVVKIDYVLPMLPGRLRTAQEGGHSGPDVKRVERTVCIIRAE